jgi:hypothetical protein
MAPDSESKEISKPLRRKLFLPDIIKVNIRRIRFNPPEYKLIESVLAEYDTAIEFMVSLDGELDLQRSLTPVLLIGKAEVHVSERTGPNEYRFLAFPFDEEDMRDGDVIGLAWPGAPSSARPTRFTYKSPNR